MKILFLGDVNGSPGRRIIKERLRALRDELGVAAVVANGENAAAGNGITVPLAKELIDAGVDVITLGDHAWGQKDLAGTIGQCPQILRPANGGVGQPGRGWDVFTTPFARFAVVNLLGRVFMGQADCPFRMADEILKARSVVGEVYLDEKIEQYIADIVFASRYPDRYGLKDLKDMISFGGSPRASINLAKAARAYAFIKRRGYVVPEDVRAVAHDVLRHRIGLTYEAEASNITSEEIVSKIVNKVEVP